MISGCGDLSGKVLGMVGWTCRSDVTYYRLKVCDECMTTALIVPRPSH